MHTRLEQCVYALLVDEYTRSLRRHARPGEYEHLCAMCICTGCDLYVPATDVYTHRRLQCARPRAPERVYTFVCDVHTRRMRFSYAPATDVYTRRRTAMSTHVRRRPSIHVVSRCVYAPAAICIHADELMCILTQALRCVQSTPAYFWASIHIVSRCVYTLTNRCVLADALSAMCTCVPGRVYT